MENKIFHQLKKLFGDNAVEESDNVYKIYFPKTQEVAGLEITEDGISDDETTTIAPNEEVFGILKQWVPANEMKHYNSAEKGVLEITQYGARFLFDKIEKLKKLKESGVVDDSFLQEYGFLSEEGFFLKYTETKEPAEEPLTEQVLAKLNGLHSTQWRMVKSDAGEEVYTTALSVQNPRGVAYYITDALRIPTEQSGDLIQRLPKGSGKVCQFQCT